MPSASNAPDLLRLGRQPGQAGILEHAVERNEATHEHFRGGDPAAASVCARRAPGRSRVQVARPCPL